jgi:hypothetical protein
MDIASQFLPAGIVLDDDGFESALKQVACPVVPTVEPDTVTDAQPLHRAAQVGLGCFEHQMEMVVHENVSVDCGPEPFGLLGKQLQEMKPVGVLAEDMFAVIAAGGDVITSAGPFDA